MSRRRFFIAAGLAGAGAVAGYLGLRYAAESSNTGPVALQAELPPQEKAQVIADALNQNRPVSNVDIAIGYNIQHRFQDPATGTAKPDGYNAGILNPIILDKDTYGYITYDQATAQAQVKVIEEKSPLTITERPKPLDPNEPTPQPYIGTGEISRAYYDLDSNRREYFTAFGEPHSPISYRGQEPLRVGEPIE